MGRTSDARDRLIASASQLIHDRGYNAVGVGEICAHAGVRKGSFYHFFPSKQRLVLEVIEDHWRLARERLEAVLYGSGSPLSRLGVYLDGIYCHHRDACRADGRQRGCPLANLALEMSTQDPLIRERLRQSFDAHIGYFTHILAASQEAGEIPPDIDVEASARGILALIEGGVLLSKVRSDTEPLADLGKQVAALIGAPAFGIARGA